MLETLSFLDETRVGIWGWGYGGYVTSMVMGSQQTVYKCGISVSPIADWLFYSEYEFYKSFFLFSISEKKILVFSYNYFKMKPRKRNCGFIQERFLCKH